MNIEFPGTSRDPITVVPKLRELQRGENIVYHVGFLAKDRERKPSVLAQDEVHRAANVVIIARAAMELWVKGTVHLTQRKLGSDFYQYIATGA